MLVTADVLWSGQERERIFPMFDSMDARGSLLVLASRVPGPMSKAYVADTSRTEKIANAVSTPRVLSLNDTNMVEFELPPAPSGMVL